MFKLMMKFKLIFACSLFINTYANIENNFIIDYFGYKNVPDIVGFSCNSDEDDFILFKYLNSKGIRVSLNKWNNESKFHIIASAKYWKVGVFLDVRCYDIDSLTSMFFEAAEYKMFGELCYWLVISNNVSGVLDLVDDRSFGISTDFVVTSPSEEEDEHALYDAYSMRDRGGSLNVTFLGNWNLQTGLTITLKQEKLARRSNLHMITLKAVFFKCAYKPENDDLNEYLEDTSSGTKDSRNKFGFNILKHLAEMHNFTLKVYEAPNWEKGDALGPIARALYNNEVDLSGSPLTMNVQRTYFLRYVNQAWPFRTCFIFRNPQPTTIKVEEIFRPLTNDVWYLMVALVIVSVKILSSVLQYEGVHNNVLKFSNSMLIVVGAICQQGTDMKMNKMSTRIAFFFIMVFSILIYNYYSASVVSARLEEPIFKINDSLTSFAKLNLKFASEWMAYVEFFMKYPDWETRTFYSTVWSVTPENQRYMRPELGFQLVQKGGFAYHTHPDVGYPYIEKHFDNREICELMEVHVARPSFTTFAVTFNSSIIEIARVGLAKISEVGLRNRQVTTWQYRKPQCQKNILSASSINMYEFASHLILLAIGMFLSILLFLVEILVMNNYLNIKFKIKVKRPKKIILCCNEV